MSLRETFDRDAELYDRARPGYPDELMDELDRLLPDQASILEVGCGTGQATRSLVARGHSLTCVELGANLAEIARRNVPQAEIVNADFETWAAAACFDAVVFFTSFHWLDPATRYAKVAARLRRGGFLAVIATQHVLPADGDRFFVEVQADYGEDDPPPPPEDIHDLHEEIDASGLFETVATPRFLWEVDYSASSYIDVLRTYSGHIALPEAKREELFSRIRRRIGARTVRKTYLSQLNFARRL